jgi:ATP-binding cassette subfamily B protein
MDEEVFKVYKGVVFYKNILSFPYGYNTRIRERGVWLSGGELQQLAIVQVLLRKLKIVILNKVTSTIDLLIEI